MSAHDLCVSILEAECLVTGGDLFAAVLSDVVAKISRGKIGYGGDAKCRGGVGGSSAIGKCVGGRLQVM